MWSCIVPLKEKLVLSAKVGYSELKKHETKGAKMCGTRI